jgi:molybdopterin molybdotransferase
MQEDVTRTGDRVRLATAPRPGAHVRRAGEDLAAGQRVLARGTRLGPHHVGLLATLERARVTVARCPVVSIVSTGDELREPGSPDRAGSVVDSNGPGLSALVRACGGVARLLPHVRDELPATTDALAHALEGADVVLTVGGASVGDHDLVRPALEALGVAIDFWRVAIKPGKPLVVGRHGRVRVLGLPGNPASAMLTFLLFGAPLLRALQGDRAPLPPVVPVRLAEALERTPGRTEFYRAQLDERACPPVARLLANQASGSATGFASADALVIVPGEVERLPAGATLGCLRLRDV